MGHLKRIGKKECCADCTPGKCDDCDVGCRIFNVVSFCMEDTFSLSKSGWTDYVAPEFYEPNQDANGGCITDGSTFSPTDGGGPELDECRRWRKRTFSSWLDHCGRVDIDDPFDCRRWTVKESVHDLDKLTPPASFSSTRHPLQTFSNFSSGGQYDNNFTTVDTDTSGEVVGCCDPATTATGTTHRARVRGAHDIIEYSRALFVAASCPVIQLRSGDGMGYESLSSPVQTEDLLSDLMDAEFAECARENCIVDTVENKAARLALTGLDSGDVVIQTRDDEDEEYCGDGMHFRFLGGAEDDDENWEQLGFHYLCPYSLPREPEGCLMRGSIAASWFWLEGGADWNCPSLGTDAGSKGNPTIGPTPGVAHIASFSVALRDMTPGASYRLTLKYRVCEIGHDADVTPNCGEAVNHGCLEEAVEEGDREWETVDRTMEFEATDWGEILALDCDELAVRIKKCQLKKIAYELNSADELGEEDAEYRTVACSAPVDASLLRVPVEVDAYYVLLSCDLEEIVES